MDKRQFGWQSAMLPIGFSVILAIALASCQSEDQSPRESRDERLTGETPGIEERNAICEMAFEAVQEEGPELLGEIEMQESVGDDGRSSCEESKGIRIGDASVRAWISFIALDEDIPNVDYNGHETPSLSELEPYASGASECELYEKDWVNGLGDHESASGAYCLEQNWASDESQLVGTFLSRATRVAVEFRGPYQFVEDDDWSYLDPTEARDAIDVMMESLHSGMEDQGS